VPRFCPLGFPSGATARGESSPTRSSPAFASCPTMRARAQVALRVVDRSSPPNVLLIRERALAPTLAENLAAGGLWLGDREIALLNQESGSADMCPRHDAPQQEQSLHAKPIEPLNTN